MWKWLGIGILSLASLGAAGNAAADAAMLMVDPLLGLSFDPAQVHFDVLDKTPEEVKLLGKRDKWIFAVARDERGAAILIVAGFHDRQSSAENSVEPDFGTLLKMDGQGLHLIGGSDYLFGKRSPVSAKVVDGLMRDASVRYVDAYGGAAGLSRALAAARMTPDVAPAPLLPHLEEQGVKFPGSKKTP